VKVVVEDAGPCRKKLRIEVPAADVAKEYEKVLSAFAKGSKIPGFRPGRAPQDIVARRYAKDIAGELQNSLVPSSYHKALEENKIDAVAIVDLDEPPPASPLQDFIFSVTVDVPPDFALPEYKGIPVQAAGVAVTDEQVKETIDGLRRQAARYDDVTDRPVQRGDLVQVDFEGTLDGKPIEEIGGKTRGLGKGAGHWVSADPDAFPPGFGEGLEGAAIGETRTIRSAYREGFPVPELAGKTADYTVTVKGLRQPVLPEMDAEFLKRFDVESADQLTARVREQLEAAAKARDRARRRDEAIAHLLSRTQMDLPASLVQRQTERNVYNLVRSSIRQGAVENQIVENKSKIFESASRSAAEMLKLRYILHRIAEAEKVAVPDEDVAADIERQARQAGVDPAGLVKRMRDDGSFDEVRGDLREAKALDQIVDWANVQ
jgi:trigger factor